MVGDYPPVSPYSRNKKKVFDNIHGYIELYEPEVKIINTELFQRLRGIQQLGMASLVYPGATHNRFAHSLGVLHVITRLMAGLGIAEPKPEAIDQFRRDKARNDVDVEVDDPKHIIRENDPCFYFTIRMAALLHDIGHLPFSHTFEPFFGRITPQGKKFKAHEYFSSLFIDLPAIKSILEHPDYALYNYDISIMQQMITGELGACPVRYVQLLHSVFDADRIDYLLRDASCTGLVFGHIDLERIYKHLSLEEGNHVISVLFSPKP
jgi:HD superfamily phosphohydrolase